MHQPTSDSNPAPSSTLSDATVRHIMVETAAEIESPDSGLYEIIEKQIKTSPTPEAARTSTGRFHWTTIITGLRTFCRKPQFAWGLVAVQAAIITIFIILPQTELHTISSSYKTLSVTTNQNAAKNLYLAIFHDSVPITAIEKLLQQTNTTITDGPGKNGIFTLKISEGNQPDREQAIKSLRNSPLVAFFEKQIN